MTIAAATVQTKSVRFRARSFVAFALAPEAPLEAWLRDLDAWTANSPGFFSGRPVVLDLNLLRLDPADVAELVAALASRGIRVYAIEASHLDALDAGLPPLLKGARAAVIEEPQHTSRAQRAAPKEVEAPPRPTTLIIDTPIRSGQSVFHPDGDVVVLGSVGSGSEIIATGSIHVYGTLRGRAFAGATGNAEARIFCSRNEAELFAVDGWYRTADDMDPGSRGGPVQAFLDKDVIWVTTLD